MFAGKAAVVTGGSRGIGYAVAEALLGQGAHVLITGTDAGRLETAAGRLAQAAIEGARVEARTADVRDAAAVAGAVDAAVRAFGGLDVLVNNAGVGTGSRVEEMTPQEWHRILDTNLTGVYHCCRAAVPHLRRRGGGWIVNVSSLASRNPFPGGAAYAASKAGLNAFTEALMQEVRHEGIRVSCVLPGSVRTGFGGHVQEGTEWKLAPEDVAEVIVDLIRHPARSLPSRVESGRRGRDADSHARPRAARDGGHRARMIGDYNPLEPLEAVGPGERFRARDTRLGRTVDLRVLPPGFAPSPADRARVLDEARVARALSHPNVTALFDAGEHDGRVFFVFELPRGAPLRHAAAGRPLSPRRAVAIGIQIADAVAEAHGRDLVHGRLDLDALVLTDKEQVKVGGFGLPTLRAWDARHAGPAGPDGGAPRGSTADEAGDIHAVGAILYELLTGWAPAPAGAVGRPTVPRELNPESSPEVDDVILRAMAPSAARYQTAVTLSAELRSVAARLDVRDETAASAETSCASGGCCCWRRPCWPPSRR